MAGKQAGWLAGVEVGSFPWLAWNVATTSETLLRFNSLLGLI